MENLIDVYKKRLRIAQDLLNHLEGIKNKEARVRTTAIVNCYNYFIIELEQEMNNRSAENFSIDLNDVLKIDAKIDLKEFYRKECNIEQKVKSISFDKLNNFTN